MLFYSDDDAAAKATVAQLIERLGFFAIDLGSLNEGGRQTQFPGGPLPALTAQVRVNGQRKNPGAFVARRLQHR